MQTQQACLCQLLLTAILCVNVSAEDWQPLWPEGAPGAHGTAPEDTPAVLAIPALPDQACGCGVIICPGGGYGGLAMDHEGHQIATWLNNRGISAWILRYRLGTHGYHHPIQRNDVLRAVRTVRAHSAVSGVDPDRIGVWGFSAGGHLASTAATHFDAGNPQAADPTDRVSSRPDFAILCYPVITMDAAFTHGGSRRNLLGPNADDVALVAELSNEKRVTPDTPPTFLFHTSEDQAVPVRNAVEFYLALQDAGVSGELHVYQRGRHGVGLAQTDPVLSSWPARLEDWLRVNRFLQSNETGP